MHRKNVPNLPLGTNFCIMTDDQIIAQIIDSFHDFALGDIEHNVAPKPIAAFILCSCLIDQLAAFRYNQIDESAKYYNEFIKDYLPQY